MQKIVFGGGCFWCMEAVFERLEGVSTVTSGYAGGLIDHPTYEQVSNGGTGHVEVIAVEYEPEIVACNVLLSVFFAMHDPTTLNRQGNDVGEQYRSVIFFTTPEQEQTAKRVIAELTADHTFANPIVTTVEPLKNFFAAENYHQRYYSKNADEGYCRVIISPKLAKLRQKFAPLLKTVS